MDVSSIAVLGLGGTGLIGVIYWLLTKIMGKHPKSKLLDIFKKKVVEEQEQEKIKEITKEQEIIIKQIEVAETSSEETKKKVKEKIKKAAVEIQAILKEDKISEIEKQIQEEWDDI